MSNNEHYNFKSRLLQSKTAGIAAMLVLSGGRRTSMGVVEILELCSINQDTPIQEVEEAVGELESILLSSRHPFWKIVDEMEENRLRRDEQATDIEKNLDSKEPQKGRGDVTYDYWALLWAIMFIAVFAFIVR